MTDPYWNHNVHYHRVVLDAVPEGCAEALDVGCGDGLLARKLAMKAGSVTAVDRSPAMIRTARDQTQGLANVRLLEADYLDDPRLVEGAYDFVTAVATVHHADFEEAIRRLQRLLAPGGRLMIVGLAFNRTPLDWVISGAGVPASRFNALLRGGNRAPAGMPVEDAAMSWGEARRTARRLLPGSRFRRRLLWRYSIVWDKPEEDGGP